MARDEALKRGYILSEAENQERRRLAEVRLKPGDVVFITVIGEPSLTHSYTITSSGEIDLGYVGRIAVAGLTQREAAIRIREHLEGRFIAEADVDVKLMALKSAQKTDQPALGR